MKTSNRLFILSILTAACLALVLSSCDMPVGLGHRVNTDVPVITIPDGGDNQPGAFLRGASNIVELDVQQQFGLREVYMTIWYHNRATLEASSKRVPAHLENGLWIVDIDTTNMVDGNIRGQVTAVDVDGNRTTTTYIIYAVKNTPPQIELNLPRLSGDAFDNTVRHPALMVDPIYQGLDIMGFASDAYGLYHGFPQIMFWPIADPATGEFPEGFNPSPADFDSVTGLPRPVSQWYVWHPMQDDQGRFFDDPILANINLRATQFRWPLLNPNEPGELPTGHYGFRIRVKDNFGTINYYPNRIDNTRGHPYYSPDLNQFIQMQVIATGNPVIRWSPAGAPAGYAGFPNFHTGNGYLDAYVTITSENRLNSKRAVLTASDNINWNAVAYSVNLQDVPGASNLFRIRISEQALRSMLGPNITGNWVLHVQAIDVQGNDTSLSRSVAIDNTPPQIELSLPRISGAAFDNLANRPALYVGRIFQGNDIMGIATDVYGIAHGYPQIMLWPIADSGGAGFDPVTGLPRPGSQWYVWQPMYDDQGRTFDNLFYYGAVNRRATQFRWPLRNQDGEELPAGYYGFRIRTRSNLGVENTYPNRTDNRAGTGGAALENSSLNQFMRMRIAAADNPIIRWSPAGAPAHYAGFPNFHSASDYLTAYVTISSGNALARTRARLSISDFVNWSSADSQHITPVSDGLFRIRMDPETLRSMLNNNIAGDRVLHVEATDDQGNTTHLSRHISIDDAPPQIELLVPRISGAAFDNLDNHPRLVAASPIFQGSDLLGMATDSFGIARGYPQIMLWPIADSDGNFPAGLSVSAGDFNPLTGLPRPGSPWYWRSMLDDQGRPFDHQDFAGITRRAAEFRWSLRNPQNGEDLPAGLYGFRIRVRDRFGTVNYYPNRIDNIHGHPASSPLLNRFMQIQISATDNPIIRWSPAGTPFHYGGFPNFHSGNEDLVVYVTITSGNVIPVRRATLSAHDSIEWGSVVSVNMEHVSGNLYRINMAPFMIQNMLGTTNISGDWILHVEAIDNLGNRSTTNRLVTIDSAPPTLVFIEPIQLGEDPPQIPDVTGTVRFRGSAQDNQRVARMYYALGAAEVNFLRGRSPDDPAGWTTTNLHTTAPRRGHPAPGNALDGDRVYWEGTLSSWSWRFPDIGYLLDDRIRNHYVIQDNPLDPECNLWELPLKFRIIDVAGNIAIVERSVLLDPDADLPSTFVTSPRPGQVVGGPVAINGRAEDNEMIHRVFMRVYQQRDQDIGTAVPPSQRVHDWIEINSGGSANVNWQVTINQDGSLNPTAAGNRLVRLEFRSSDASIDAPGTHRAYGRITSILLEFSNEVPFIDRPVILWGRPSEIIPTGHAEMNRRAASIIANPGNNPYGVPFDEFGNTTISGFVTMRIMATSPAAALASVSLRTAPRLAETITILGAGQSLPANMDRDPWAIRMGSGNQYAVFIPLNTNVVQTDTEATAFGSGFAVNSASVFQMEVLLTDTAEPPFTGRSTFTLRTDNRHPFGDFRSARTVIAANHTITGRAWDHGDGVSVHGIARVLVYFSRPGTANNNHGTPLTPSGANAVIGGSGGWITTQSVMTGRTGTPPPGAAPANTIDGTHTTLPFFPAAVGPNGGILATLANPPVYDWSVDVDFTGFDNGPLTIHYVVFDHAGNATHNSQEIFLAVNAPRLANIYLGTHAPGVETAERSVPVLHDEIEGDFRVRNNSFTMRLDLGPNPGNTIFYDVAHVTTRISRQASQMVAGGVYTIDYPGNVNWLNYGVFVDLVDPANPINPRGITFVAIRPGSTATGTGTVYENVIPSTPSATRRDGRWQNVNTTLISFSGNASGDPFYGIGAARPIQDSTRVYVDGGVNFAPRNDRIFLVRVTDRSVGRGVSGISNAVLVRVDIHNDDRTPPRIDIAHFGRMVQEGETIEPNFANRRIVPVAATDAGYNMNIVMSGSARMGYVQHHEHSGYFDAQNTFRLHNNYRADISGRVIFRGRAMDNNRIQSITATVGTPGAAVTGTTAQGITTSASGAAVAPGPVLIATWCTATNRLIQAPGIPAAWAFRATSQINTLDFGHVLNWQIEWDSSTLDGVVGENVPITFTVEDFAPPDAAPRRTSQTIRVNVVPYITEIETPLSQTFRQNPSAFNRSARGWYPVRENDPITIRGFNLGGSGAATVVSLPGDTDLAASIVTSTRILANIGADAVSGPLVVRVTPASGGTAVTSINNRNHPTIHYNREPNRLNNDTLTDDRYFYVWRVGAFHTNAVEFPFRHPVMHMNPNSDWVLAYGGEDTSSGAIMVARGGDAPGLSRVTSANNRWRNIGVSMDSSGNLFTVGSDQTAGQTRFRFLHRIGSTGTGGSASGTGGGSAAGDGWNLVASDTAGSLLPPAGGDRFMLPRIATRVAGNNTRIALSYFDALDNRYNNLRVNFGMTGGASPDVLNAPQIVAHNETTHEGSMFSAVGFLQTGRAVIAWFDRSNMNLVLSHHYSGDFSAARHSDISVASVQTTSGDAATAGITGRAGTPAALPADVRTFRVPDASLFQLGERITLTHSTSTARFFARNAAVTTSVYEGLYVVWRGSGAATATGNGNTIALSREPNPFNGAADDAEVEAEAFFDAIPDGATGVVITRIAAYRALSIQTTAGTVTSNDATGRAGAPAVLPTGVRTFRVPDASRFVIGEEVKLTFGSTVYENLFVVWRGSGAATAAGNGNSIALRHNNTSIGAATTFFNTIPAGAAEVSITRIDPATRTAQWQDNARVIHGPDATRGPITPAGSHVDMAIDANNNIHLAYFDVLNGGLYYAWIPPTGSGTDMRPDYTRAQVVRVDSFLSAGTRVMINVRRETHAGNEERDVPYISYFHASFDETRSSVRVAWRRDFTLVNGNIRPGSDENDRLTGAWEVMTVPVHNVPASGKIIANGVPTSGYLTGTAGLEHNTPLPGRTQPNDIRRTMLVAYLTTHNFEGAILKYDIISGSGR